jgi:hypothetical protein
VIFFHQYNNPSARHPSAFVQNDYFALAASLLECPAARRAVAEILIPDIFRLRTSADED